MKQLCARLTDDFVFSAFSSSENIQMHFFSFSQLFFLSIFIIQMQQHNKQQIHFLSFIYLRIHLISKKIKCIQIFIFLRNGLRFKNFIISTFKKNDVFVVTQKINK